jgi:predicted O-methyltransferase YrrM
METYLSDYNALKRRIDEVRASSGDAELEVRKSELLKSCEPYMRFIERVTGVSRPRIETHIDECARFLATDAELKQNFALLATDSESGIATGEIRVHSYTLFLIVRALKPERFLETGVANGKSSLMMLAAMDLNGRGTLVSVDMATIEASGADRHKAQGKAIGWLVPERLRSRWDLRIGSSHDVLPAIGDDEPRLDIFMHDSLSSYENMMFEYGEARRLVKPQGLLISDDIETCGAFSEFSASHGADVTCFGTLGVMRFKPGAGAS